MDAAGQVLAASAPRGGAITFWSVAERRYLSSLPLGDGCGVAPSGEPGGVLASRGYGRLVPQLGRECCRESVCRYVWITVVAVHLEQKKKINIQRKPQYKS